MSIKGYWVDERVTTKQRPRFMHFSFDVVADMPDGEFKKELLKIGLTLVEVSQADDNGEVMTRYIARHNRTKKNVNVVVYYVKSNLMALDEFQYMVKNLPKSILALVG